VTTNKRKPRIARSKDRLKWVDWIIDAETPKERDHFIMRAWLTRFGGRHNERFNWHRGRPKGASTLNVSDDISLGWMAVVRDDTGETRPHKLARMCIEAGKANVTSSEASTRKRLVRKWKIRT